MEREIMITTKDTTFSVKNICPHCHNFIEPILEADTDFTEIHDKLFRIGLLFKCPACQKFFCITYNEYKGNTYPIECNYNPNLNLNIPDGIEKLSPQFTEIYTQALTAEYYKLDKIAGIGLRKSIEFLIKDYLINYKKEDPKTIKNLMLGKTIDRINNSKIQTLARATTWIGNDETHYERRYENKDINDMKKFINALLHFISFELIADEADAFIAPSIAK